MGPRKLWVRARPSDSRRNGANPMFSPTTHSRCRDRNRVLGYRVSLAALSFSLGSILVCVLISARNTNLSCEGELAGANRSPKSFRVPIQRFRIQMNCLGIQIHHFGLQPRETTRLQCIFGRKTKGRNNSAECCRRLPFAPIEANARTPLIPQSYWGPKMRHFGLCRHGSAGISCVTKQKQLTRPAGLRCPQP